jgi:predicted transcriptional regulator
MNVNILDRIIRDARSWPAEDQAELADYARVIEARRTGIYSVSDDERAAIAEGLAEANQGVFADDDALARLSKRFRE